MAVQDNGTRIQYTATASQTVFPYPFEILDEDDITVVQNSTTLSKTTHYTVSGVGSDTGGNITFVTGATSGDVITIYRSMALSRVTNYQANAAFLESEVDADFDRLWMAQQQTSSDATRGIRASQTDSILNSTNTELAIPATRAGKVLGFDSTGALSYYASTVASADFIQVTTTAAMAALASPTVGDVVETAEFSTGNGGGGTYDCVTVGTTANVDLPNTYNIIVSTVDATKCFVLRITTPQDVAAFGNSSGAIQAMDGLVKWGVFTNSSLVMDVGVTFSNPIRLTGAQGHKITPSMGLGGGKLFAFESSDIHVEWLNIDGTGETFTPATATTYLIFGGDGSTKYRNHTYINNTITSVSFSDGLTGTSNLIVSHGLYIDNVDNVTIDHNDVTTLSGAAVFIRDVDNLSIQFNDITDSIWYPIHLVGGASNFEIAHNNIISNQAAGVFYGGAIDLMSQQTPMEVRNIDGSVHNNYIEGTMSYGSAIRCLSAENVDIYSNTIKDIVVGSVSLSPTLTAIRVDTRGISSGVENGPCKNINIFNNKMTPGLNGSNEMLGVYVSNQWQTARVPLETIRVYGNEIESVDSTHFWENCIIFQGNEGGIENIYCKDNICSSKILTGPVVDGVIGFVAANAQGEVNNIHIGSNKIVDIGTPASSFQLGIGYGAYVDQVFNDSPNTIDNFYYGIRTFTNSGPTLDRLDDNQYLNIGLSDELLGVNLSRYGLVLEGSATYDPPSLTTGAFTFTDVTVTGAAVGDRVEATFSLNQDGVIFTGYVRTANSCRIYLENKDASTKDLGSGTLTVKVYR